MTGAIETVYKGNRFRSRLEARWAVFFDAMDIKWLYEPEGFEAYGQRYLPDFYLPESMTWVEVKGGDKSLNDDRRKLEAVLDFSSPIPYVGNSWFHGSTHGLVILGNIPDKTNNTVLHPIVQHKSGLWVEYVYFSRYGLQNIDMSFNPIVSKHLNLERSFDYFSSNGFIVSGTRSDTEQAYDKARMARFEHGEKP